MSKNNNKSNNIFKKIITLGGVLTVVFALFKKRKIVKEVVENVAEDIVDVIPKDIKDKFKKIEKKSEKKIINYEKSLHKKIDYWLKDFIIPHEGNNHHPKGLHPKALTSYVVIILLVKIIVTGSLFFIYPNTGLVTSKITDDLYKITNQERISAGLQPLVINEELKAAAMKKASDMVAGHYFAHIGPDGKKPWEWINKKNYNFTYMGENLAMDFSSAKVVNSAFMKSPSHKANIMHKEYSDVGMALMIGEIEGRETMILVQFYGKPKVTDSLTVATAQVVKTTTNETTPKIVKTQNIVSKKQPVVESVNFPESAVENITEDVISVEPVIP